MWYAYYHPFNMELAKGMLADHLSDLTTCARDDQPRWCGDWRGRYTQHRQRIADGGKRRLRTANWFLSFMLHLTHG